MTCLRRIPALITLTISCATFAGPVTFTGVDTGSGPPFPSSPISLSVIDSNDSPLQTLLASIPRASAGSGLQFQAFGSDSIAKFDAAKLSNFDFPGQYSERFEAVDLAGQHHPVSVLAQSFDSRSFGTLLQLDLPASPPENHLYYHLTGSIYPSQTLTFSSFSAIAFEGGYFEINFNFSSTGPINPDRPVLLMDMTGTTTPIPGPAAISFSALMLLGASRATRQHRWQRG